MEREEVIRRLTLLGNRLATQKGYTEIQNQKNDGGPFWGQALIEALEKEHGDCSNEIRWYNPYHKKPENGWGDNFEFRFRFSSPCLAFDQRKVDGSLIEIELSNYDRKTEKHNGEWHISQITIFGDNLDYAKFLRDLVVEQVLQNNS